MTLRINPTAIVDPTAVLSEGVVVGAYSVIEAGVVIGADCEIGPFCRFANGTSVGERNRFESHCSVGAPPQDLKYRGEPTRLEIGHDNWVREFVTMHRGTPNGGGVTRVGDSGLFMAYSHVAHDCQIGSNTIFANSATLAGHVHVGDFATIGGLSAVHQFSRIGRYAFLGGFTGANKDCLPFMSTVGNRPAKCYGPNMIGLERQGFSKERRQALKELWRLLHSTKLNASQAIEKATQELAGQQDVDYVLEFIASSKRGVILG